MNDFPNVLVIKMMVKGMAGADVDDCLRGAILMAVTENRRVEIEINGTSYEVNPLRMVEFVKDEMEYSRSRGEGKA